jgi:hypothetical protein
MGVKIMKIQIYKHERHVSGASNYLAEIRRDYLDASCDEERKRCLDDYVEKLKSRVEVLEKDFDEMSKNIIDECTHDLEQIKIHGGEYLRKMYDTPTPTPEDFELADLAKARRELHPDSQPTKVELEAINRIIVEQARERTSKTLLDLKKI